MKRLFTIIVMLFCSFLFAQDNPFTFGENIKQFEKDSYGNLYVIGNKSICKLKGNELSNNCLFFGEVISAVELISDDYFAVAFNEKIVFYKNQKIVDEISTDEVITKLERVGEQLLIGTLGAGLYSYFLEDKKLNQVFLDQFITDIVADDGHFFVLTANQIMLFSYNNKLLISKQLSEIQPKQLVYVNEGELAILMESGNIIFMNHFLEVDYTYYTSKYKPISLISFASTLFAIDNQYLLRWNGVDFIQIKAGNFEQFTHNQSVIFTSFKKNILTHNTLIKTKITNETFSVVEFNNQFWLGRTGKISILQEGEIQNEIIFPRQYQNIHISSLAVTPKIVYAGTMGRGILMFDTKSGQFLGEFQRTSNMLNEQNIIQLKIHQNLLWVGYLNGLKAYDLTTQKLVKDYSKLLDNNYLYTFLIKNSNEFYIGTSDSGLLHVVNDLPRKYMDGFSVYSISKSLNQLFFSVEGKGVYSIQDDRLYNLNDKYFLRSQNTYNMFQVNQFLCIANDLGIDIININQQKMKYFSYDNMNEPHLNSNALSKTNGIIGYEGGFAEINLAMLSEVFKNDTLQLVPMVFNQRIEGEKNQFSYDENAWSFQFEATNYTSNKNNYFKYRLLPVNLEWTTTTQEEVVFYNLPPNNYRFEVDYGGHRNFIPKQNQAFQFTIAKPFWGKIWFWIIMLTVLLMLIYLIVKFRENQIKKKEALKNIQLQYEYQRLKDQINPHFLFNSFNSLIGVVEEDPKQASLIIEKLSYLFRTVLKNEKINLISIQEELQLISDYFDIHKIRYQDLINLHIDDIQQSKNKYVVPFSFQLLIENAIKHTIINSKNKLYISINEEHINGQGFICIKNNFNKKSFKNNSLGLGLENLKKRHEMIINKKPIIQISETHFTVKIPYKHD